MPKSLADFLADCLHAAALATASSLARDFTPATYPRLTNDDLLVAEFGREIDFRGLDVLADWSNA